MKHEQLCIIIHKVDKQMGTVNWNLSTLWVSEQWSGSEETSYSQI